MSMHLRGKTERERKCLFYSLLYFLYLLAVQYVHYIGLHESQFHAVHTCHIIVCLDSRPCEWPSMFRCAVEEYFRAGMSWPCVSILLLALLGEAESLSTGLFGWDTDGTFWSSLKPLSLCLRPTGVEMN